MTSTNEDFSQFWSRYPKKRARQAAWKAYRKARATGASAEAILAGLERYREHMPADVQFRPHPGTWLTQGRWLDEYDDEPAPTPRPPVEGRRDCRHEPRCVSNEWHAVMLDRERKRGAA